MVCAMRKSFFFKESTLHQELEFRAFQEGLWIVQQSLQSFALVYLAALCNKGIQ